MPFGDAGEHLQALGWISANNTNDCRGFHTAQIFGGRHDHALYIFDDISTALYNGTVGKHTEHIARLGRRKSDCYRFGASQRRNQFLLKNLQIILVSFLCHFILPPPFEMYHFDTILFLVAVL